MKALLLTACFAVMGFSVARSANNAAAIPPIQYDEIERTVTGGATPAAAADAFSADFAHLKDGKLYAVTPQQQQQPKAAAQKVGLENLTGAIFNPTALLSGGGNPLGALSGVGNPMALLAGGNPLGALTGGDNAMGSLSSMAQQVLGGAASQSGAQPTTKPENETAQAGRAAHVAYYRQFVRYENLADKTVILVDTKTQKHTRIDLAKRQYRVVTESEDETGSGSGGTAAVALTIVRTRGADATIAGVPATEYNTVTTASVTNATGSCKSGNMRFETVEYVAKTLLGPPAVSATFSKFWVQHPHLLAGEGCTGKVHTTSSGPMIPSSHLVMYSRTLIDMPGKEGSYIIMERGNARSVTASEATSLFTVPAGFTQQ